MVDLAFLVAISGLILLNGLIKALWFFFDSDFYMFFQGHYFGSMPISNKKPLPEQGLK